MLASAISNLDLSVSLRLHKLNSGFLTRSFAVFSALGSERIFVPIGLLVAVWALAEQDFVAGFVLVAATLLTRQSIYVLKALTSRSRPAVARLESSSFRRSVWPPPQPSPAPADGATNSMPARRACLP